MICVYSYFSPDFPNGIEEIRLIGAEITGLLPQPDSTGHIGHAEITAGVGNDCEQHVGTAVARVTLAAEI